MWLSQVGNAMTLYACPAACFIWFLALAFPVSCAASSLPHHLVMSRVLYLVGRLQLTCLSSSCDAEHAVMACSSMGR